MRQEKKLDDWVRRELEMESRGIHHGVIGSPARSERMRARQRKAGVYRDVVIRAGKSSLKMAIVGKPELGDDRVKLGFILELPLEGDGPKLAMKAGPAFEALVNDAVSESRKAERRPAPRRSRRRGSA